MIGAIMILAVVAYLVWTFWGRAFHVIGQYKKGGSQFKLSEPLDYEAIYQKLKEGLQYPDNRNLFYGEFGQPSIAGRYGTYTIHTEDTLLTVQAETNGKLNKNMRQTEEAMCLAAYIRKIFEPAAPVNPYQLYKRMRHARRNSLIISVVLIIAAAAYSMAVLSPALDDTAKVRNAYLSQYTFTTDEWKIFFASAEWYHADSAYSNDMLNATEKANVDTILNYEKSAGGQQEKTRPEDMASQAALNYCQTTGWTNSRVNFVESRPAGGYYVNVMKIDDSDNSYEENYVVTVENGKAIVTGTEQFGEFTPID